MTIIDDLERRSKEYCERASDCLQNNDFEGVKLWLELEKTALKVLKGLKGRKSE